MMGVESLSDDSLIPSVPEIPTPSDAEELLNHIEEMMDKTYDMCVTLILAIGFLIGMYLLFRLWMGRSGYR